MLHGLESRGIIDTTCFSVIWPLEIAAFEEADVLFEEADVLFEAANTDMDEAFISISSAINTEAVFLFILIPFSSQFHPCDYRCPL